MYEMCHLFIAYVMQSKQTKVIVIFSGETVKKTIG